MLKFLRIFFITFLKVLDNQVGLTDWLDGKWKVSLSKTINAQKNDKIELGVSTRHFVIFFFPKKIFFWKIQQSIIL